MKNKFKIRVMFSPGKEISRCFFIALLVFFGCKAGAQNINMINKKGPLGTEVNTYSGNIFISRNEFFIPARGFDLDMMFYYNSYSYDQNIGFGNGWSLGLSIQYFIDTAGNNTIIWGDGREDTYTAMGGGVFKSPVGFNDTLSQYQANKYVLTEMNGTRYFFDNSSHRKITKMVERNGNYINFNYTDSLLISLVNNSGQTISFTYDGYGRLSTVVDAITSPTRTWTYTYDGAGNLKQVTDPLGGTNKYNYLVNGPMKNLSDKNNNTVDIIYYPNFAVSELIGCNKRQSYSYDTATHKTIVTDYVPTGTNQVTTYIYTNEVNGLVWLSSMISNCCGYNMTFEYDINGNKTKQTDANGNITLYTYDSHGNMLTRKDALNQTITYTYTTSFYNISSYTDARGNVTTMAYDNSGNLVQLTAPGNLIYTATYNSFGDIITSTDPKGNTYTYNYDAYGNPVSVTGPNGYHANLGVDARGHLLSYTDALGNTTHATYDILDRLKVITDPMNNTLQLTYDAEGNAIIFKDQNNETTQLNYDASNRLVKFTDALNNKSYISYDAMDNTIEEKNALGNAMNYSYDTKNRLTGIKDALGNFSSFNYDANGNVIAITLPNGEHLAYSYDPLNRVTAVSDDKGAIANLVYDPNDNVTGYTNGSGAITTLSYDSVNRIKQITDPLGNSYNISYDNNSNITSIADRNGFVKYYTYDGLNRLQTYTDNNGYVITLTYDAEGNVLSVKDQNNNITHYTYDNLNRVSLTTYPDGKYIQYTYDNKGNIISKRLTDGTSIGYQYDSLNRIVSKTLPGGNLYTYTYNAMGRVVTATNNAGTVYITYDALNRVASENYDGRTTYYNYNIAGRTQTTIYPDSSVLTKNFDTRNRLTSIVKNNTTLISYVYNNANQVTVKNFANGVTTNLQYDFANRLINISTAAGSIQNSSFAYDKELNKTVVTRPNTPSLSEQFTYDHGYRLTSYHRGALQNNYNYDAVGNRTSANLNGINTIYGTNNLNQLTSSNNGSQNITFTYDNNGNLTYDGQFYKQYDAEGRLIKDSASAVQVLTYQYDAFGRRIQKTYNGAPFKYTYSGFNQIEERDGITNTLLNRTIYQDLFTPVANEKNGSIFYYHQNEMNSVEAITNSAGNVKETYQYDVFGKPSVYDSSGNIISGSLTGNRFAFTGQEYDTASGGYRFYFRNYSPVTGTFNQRDLIGYSDGLGLYQYVHNNPANGIDIFGLEDCPPKKKLDEGGVVDNTTTDVADRVGNWLTIVSKFKALAEKSKFKGTKMLVDINNLEVKINKYNDANNGLSDKDRQAIGGDIELAIMGIGADLTPETPYTAAPKAVIGTVGYVDAATQEVTSYLGGGGSGMSLSYIYAHQSDAPEATGKGIADNFNEGFTRREKELMRYEQENGSDMSKWDVKHRLMHNLQESIKRNRKIQPIPPVPNPKPDCPQNGPTGGTRKKVPLFPGSKDSVSVIQSGDPNTIIGPDGVPTRRWVSVHDRLPYTILYENSKAATAPAKFVRITSPIEPKEDAGTFQLGNFGFNNQTFTVPNNAASYYQRLDCRDSLELYVDITAGYDPVGNQAFWEFQSIDPVTLLPPADPLKGFLLLQDSSKPLYGHAFVNFSMKPLQTAATLDTIGARAKIVFDLNDTIPTNITVNTIDAVAPTSHMNPVVTTNGGNPVTLSWTGTDDPGGSGIQFYTVYVSTDLVNYSMLIPRISRNDTTLSLPPDSNYCFFVLATDRVGNSETLRPNETQCTGITAPLPVTWLYFNGKTVGKNNILNWATANEQNSKQFNVERSLDALNFGQIGVVNAAGNSSQDHAYQYTDPNIDRLNSTYFFYRLKQVDLDGSFRYSNTIRLSYNPKNTSNSVVYPNPTNGLITILVGDNSLIGTVAVLYDANGKMLQNIKITAASQSFSLGQYVNGVYFIRLGNKEVLKIVKQ
jgi:RHS repeat-associated protein